MGHINRRHAEVLLQLLEFRPHDDPQLRIEVAQRLVHQEDGRLPHDRTAKGDPLPLAPAELSRLPTQERLDLEQLGGPVHPVDDFALRKPRVLQREGHVPVDGHVRIQRITLEHHRDVPFLRIQIVHQAIPDVDLSSVRLFEPSDASEGRRLATARGAEEDDEFLVAHLQVQVLDRDGPFELFPEAPDLHARHWSSGNRRAR